MNDKQKDLKSLWNLGSFGFSDEVKKYGEEMREWLRGMNDDVSAYLFGDSTVIPADDSMREIAKKITKRFPPLKKSCHCTYILSAVVNRGNENKLYEICPPPISIYVKRDPSPFLKSKHQSLSFVPAWNECLKRSLTEGCTTDPWEVQIGQVLASAVLHGGLCDSTLLVAFYEKLAGQIQVIEETTYFDLELPCPLCQDRCRLFF